MARLQQILCPVDLSEISGHAFDHALALARSHRARLTVMAVWWRGLPPVAFPIGIALIPPVQALAGEEGDIEEQLRRFVNRPAATGVQMDVVLREGAVAPKILEEARTINADLIVIGTHGRSGFDRVLLGSVTEKILRKAECAVMTVPPHDQTSTPSRAGRTIVCAVDFSPLAVEAVAQAIVLAHELKSGLLLVHVTEWAPERTMSPADQIRRETDQVAARRQLEALVPADVRAWCPTEELVTVGRPYEEIVRVARDRDADLIVLGVHGRSAVTPMLFGSTANQVVRHATCPVVTVRA